jgi:hypothetical protein
MPFSATDVMTVMSDLEENKFTYRHLIRLGGDLVCESEQRPRNSGSPG